MRIIFEPDRGQRVPIRLWARAAATETIRQLQRLASQPYVVEHVAVTLERAIPTGDATHRGRGVDVPDAVLSPRLSTHALERARERLACRHLGTLGGGNHFLELDRDAENGLWLLVHSGSRGLGAAVAEHHTRAAKASEGGILATLDAETDEGTAYFDDASWALDFARANRRALARRALEVVSDVLGDSPDCTEHIDIHHNFVAREHWYGRDLLIHRKGAVAVPNGTLSLIPGSMGTASYIVDGLRMTW